jgi:hypothetical protein
MKKSSKEYLLGMIELLETGAKMSEKDFQVCFEKTKEQGTLNILNAMKNHIKKS